MEYVTFSHHFAGGTPSSGAPFDSNGSGGALRIRESALLWFIPPLRDMLIEWERATASRPECWINPPERDARIFAMTRASMDASAVAGGADIARVHERVHRETIATPPRARRKAIGQRM